MKWDELSDEEREEILDGLADAVGALAFRCAAPMQDAVAAAHRILSEPVKRCDGCGQADSGTVDDGAMWCDGPVEGYVAPDFFCKAWEAKE